MITKSQLKYIRSLHRKKNREKEKVFIAEGVKIAGEVLLESPANIKMIVYTAENKPYVKPGLLSEDTQVLEVNSDDFQKISILKNPQGVLMILKKPDKLPPEHSELGNIILVLDSIRDPGNLGTIIRLADWFGIRNIFCSDDTVECYNPKVVQATMGAIFRVNVFYTSLKKFLPELNESGFTIYGTALDGENIYTKQLKFPAAVILGNEAHGISHDLVPVNGEYILIPSFNESVNRSESLNVSVAAAIICSEFLRRNV